FEVQLYVIQWVSADPSYDYVFDLVPGITLYESQTDDPSGAIAFVHFRHDKQVRGASYDDKRNIFYLDFPLSFAQEVLHLIKSGHALTLIYKEEDKRKWVELQTKPLPLVHPRKKR